MDQKIMVDLDGVILDFNRVIRDCLGSQGIDLPEGYIPSSYKWEEDPLMKDHKKEIEDLLDNLDPYWILIDPFPGAKEFLLAINTLGYEIHYCTARSSDSGKRAALQCILGDNFPIDSINFSTHKGPLAKSLGIHLAIEDSPDKIEDLESHGCRVLIRKWKYNRDLCGGRDCFETYKDAIGILKALK